MIDYRKFLDKVDDQYMGDTLNMSKSHSDDDAVIAIKKYFIEHPVLLRQEFQKFDRRQTG